ncbi:unnamed protein product, partial [Brassica oleracea]
CNVSISYIFYLLIIYFSLYCKFTYYLFSIFLNNNATSHILGEFFSLMWTLYVASKNPFY